jgi:nucleotide-binding universal stress UspA family protein
VLTVSGPKVEDEADAPVRIEGILCAASGSPHSPETVDYARTLAEGTHAGLTFVHVFDPAQPAGREVRPWKDRLASTSVRVREETAAGAAGPEILRCARECGADLAVLGLHDRGPGTVGRVGSTADAVVRGAERGVVTLRAEASVETTDAVHADIPHAVGEPK